MNPDAIQRKGVAPAPLYEAVPCDDSTGPMSAYIVQHTGHMGTTAKVIEVLVLRWLVDNNMMICKRN